MAERVYFGHVDIPLGVWYQERWNFNDTTIKRQTGWYQITGYTSMVDPATNKVADYVSIADGRWLSMADLFNKYEWCSRPGQSVPIFKCTIPPVSSLQPKQVLITDSVGNTTLQEQ